MRTKRPRGTRLMVGTGGVEYVPEPVSVPAPGEKAGHGQGHGRGHGAIRLGAAVSAGSARPW